MTAKRETPIEKLVRISGGAPVIAAKLGVSHQFVYVCLGRGWFPPARAKALEKLYGVPRKKLMKPALVDLLN